MLPVKKEFHKKAGRERSAFFILEPVPSANRGGLTQQSRTVCTARAQSTRFCRFGSPLANVYVRRVQDSPLRCRRFHSASQDRETL
ncbi:hypothetical protein HNR34_002649 [Geobacillus subterraneus]